MQLVLNSLKYLFKISLIVHTFRSERLDHLTEEPLKAWTFCISKNLDFAVQ